MVLHHGWGGGGEAVCVFSYYLNKEYLIESSVFCFDII